MTNPWVNLPAIGNAEYVLPCDAGDVARHNDKYKNSNFEIVVNEIPEPWLGRVKEAPVVVLQLNPRYCTGPRASVNARIKGARIKGADVEFPAADQKIFGSKYEVGHI